MALTRYQSFGVDEAGNVLGSQPVTVYYEATGAIAVICSDSNGTIKANPFTTDADGYFFFYAVGGLYRIDVGARSLRDVPIGSAAGTDVGTIFNPRGAYSGATTYAKNDLVSSSSGGAPYAFIANADGTVGHAPPFSGTVGISDAFWTVAGLIASPALFALSVIAGGIPGSAEVLEGHVFTDAITFPAGLGSSKATVDVAATVGSAVFTILKNKVSVGTVTFAVGAFTGTFAMASNLVTVAGDQVDIQAPSPANAALSGVKITLRGSR